MFVWDALRNNFEAAIESSLSLGGALYWQIHALHSLSTLSLRPGVLDNLFLLLYRDRREFFM